jgi:hypothetical protein
MQNFQIRMDLEDLQSAYGASLAGLVHREAEIEIMVRSQLGLGPDDDWPVGNDDDPEDPISLLYERAGELDAQAKRGAPMVRKAFVIALFHAWERHCNARLRRDHYDHTVVRDRILIRDGHAAQWTVIRELQLAANCAKHGPGDSCVDLYNARPDWFPKAKTDSEASEKTLVIGEGTLNRFFAAVLTVSH